MITRYEERYAMLTDFSHRFPASFLVHAFVPSICLVLVSSSLYPTCGVLFRDHLLRSNRLCELSSR